MNPAPGMDRGRALEALRSRSFDVLVIGGGITGAGVALDAVSRGMRVALVEKDDFASGTSSRSSKLVHGGLRYLKQLQFGVMVESIREREVLLGIVPHLVEPLQFLLPFRRSPMSRISYAAALTIYDAIAGHSAARRHTRISLSEVRHVAPLLGGTLIAGAFQYFDARTDDCRLVMHVIRKACELGALVANYVEVRGFRMGADGHVAGVDAVDAVSGDAVPIEGRAAVNATGVWCDAVRRRFDSGAPELVRPSKGIHLVLDSSKLEVSQGVSIPKTSRGQGFFVVPWEGRTIVGTTDTPYDGTLERPVATSEEIELLLSELEEWFPRAKVGKSDIISTYAGLRPLLKRGQSGQTSKAARDAYVEMERGLITVTGGKLTTYRGMAQRVVDLLTPARCITDRLKLFASHEPPRAHDQAMAAHLHRAYGSEAAGIAGMDGAATRIDPELPYSIAEVDYAIRSEMSMTVGDVLARRIRLSLTSRDQRTGAELVASRLAVHHGWGTEKRTAAVADYMMEIAEFSPHGANIVSEKPG